MTKKIMLINETHDESRIAILENNILQEMLIEYITEAQIKNNLYKGIVVKAQPSLQAAFVDFGHKKHGFLQNSEVNPDALNNNGANGRYDSIQEKLDRGQSLLVQVVKEAVDQKGAVLTTNISLPGRFMVLMPHGNKGGISKKIEDPQERERLRSFVSGINSGRESVIIRTAGQNRSLSELKKDYTALKKIWKEIKNSYEDKVKPGLLYREADAVIRTLRDYYTNDIQEIWIDNPETYQRALKFFKTIAPRRQKILKLFVSDHSLFSSYNIEKQVEQLTSRHVKLKSGGSIIIDQTEALVAVDVNSGKSNQEGNIQATALRTNTEAAAEVARQLRLRNLGGLVVIDFIDMDAKSANKKVEKHFQEAMKRDKAQYKMAPISEFGLMEISRQRLAIGISSTVESMCPTCHGKGKIPSLLASTNLALRSIREMAAGGNLRKVNGELPLEMANHLLNECRQSITDLELEFGVDVILKGNPEIAVFDPKRLKPVFEEKYQAKQTSPSTKKNAKGSSKKKSCRHEENEREVIKEDQNKPAPISKDEKDTEEVAAKPEQPEQPEQPKTVGDPLESAYDIHPSCLFPNVRELSEQEMIETLESFGKRLKGELDEEPYQIDKKYLWNSVYSNDLSNYQLDEPKTSVESDIPQEAQTELPKPEAGKLEKKAKAPAKTTPPKKKKAKNPPQKEAEKKKPKSSTVKKNKTSSKKTKASKKNEDEASTKSADKESKKKKAEKDGKAKSAGKKQEDLKSAEEKKSESVREKETSPKSAAKAPRKRRSRGGRKKARTSSETPKDKAPESFDLPKPKASESSKSPEAELAEIPNASKYPEKTSDKASQKAKKESKNKSIPAKNNERAEDADFFSDETVEEIENLAIQFLESMDEESGLGVGTNVDSPKEAEAVLTEAPAPKANEDSQAPETKAQKEVEEVKKEKPDESGEKKADQEDT